MWKEWKATYTKAERKATVKRMSAKNVEQFDSVATGSARNNGGGSGGGANPPAGRPSPVTLDELEGCFDSLAGAAVTGK